MYVAEVTLGQGPSRLRGWIVAYTDKLLKQRRTPEGVTIIDWDTFRKLAAMAFVQDDQAWGVLTKFTWLVNRMSYWGRVTRLAAKHGEEPLREQAGALWELAREAVARVDDAWIKSLKAKKFYEKLVRTVKEDPTIAFTDEVWSTIKDLQALSLFGFVPMYKQIKEWRKAAYAYEHGGPFYVPKLEGLSVGLVIIIVALVAGGVASVHEVVNYLHAKLEAEKEKRIDKAIEDTAKLILKRKEAATVEEAYEIADRVVRKRLKRAEELARVRVREGDMLGKILWLAGAAVGVFLLKEVIGLFKKEEK